jgi:O-antigen ligase
VNILFPFLLFIAVLIFSILALNSAGAQDYLVFTELNVLSYISLALFLIIVYFSAVSDRIYFSFLIFVIFAFPAPVNDFFPGAYMGDFREQGAAIFPFFTHIDLFLCLGVLKGIIRNHKISFVKAGLFVFTIICLFTSFLLNYFKDNTAEELLLLVQGTYQIRYLIELFLLLSLNDIMKFKNNVLIGVMLSVPFLLAEAVAFTLKSHLPALSSGSLANNTFASIIAAVLLFLIVIRRNYPFSPFYQRMILATIFFAIVIVIGTGARMAILAFFVSYFIYSYMRDRKRSSLKKKLYWILSIVIFVTAIFVASSLLPKRYNPKTIIGRVHFSELSTDLTKTIQIDRSWETNSLITRLQLYTTSINMFITHPVEGIGAGRWDLYKNKYGFPEFLLIDSHNGYLSVISQYGLLGIPLIFLIYIFPIIRIYRLRSNTDMPFLFFLALINFYIAIADLSNSGIFKHQIFALLAFNTLCLLQIRPPASVPVSRPIHPSLGK